MAICAGAIFWRSRRPPRLSPLFRELGWRRLPPSPGTLQTIAQISGGQFFRARTSAAVKQVYERLATRVGHRTENREITDMFAGGAIVLLLLGGGLSAFWFRRIV